MSKPRFFDCRYCARRAPCTGARSVIGVGRCCAECVEEIRQVKPVPAPTPAAANTIGDWPRKVARAPAPPVRRTDGVTVCPSPSIDPRYQVDPATRFEGGFSSLGVGRYLPEDA